MIALPSAIPTQTDFAALFRPCINVFKIKKKSGPGASNAKKCVIAIVKNNSILIPYKTETSLENIMN